MLIVQETTRIHHATKAKAEKLASLFEGEYPALVLVAVEGENETLSHFATYHRETLAQEQDDWTLVLETAKVPELADVVEACEEAELDAEQIEAKQQGMHVPEKYRLLYAEVSSTGRSNGDWLAEWLADETIVDDKTDYEKLRTIFEANDLDLSRPWAKSSGRGAEGRFRMNGRQVLQKQVALVGFVKDATGKKVPQDRDFGEWLAHVQEKHASWIAKQNKAAKAAVGEA